MFFYKLCSTLHDVYTGKKKSLASLPHFWAIHFCVVTFFFLLVSSAAVTFLQTLRVCARNSGPTVVQRFLFSSKALCDCVGFDNAFSTV